MIIADELYTSGPIRPKELRAARKSLLAGKIRAPWFVVALSSEPGNELVIYPAFELRQGRVDFDRLFVVGLGKGYFHSLGLVSEIVKDVYGQTKDAKLREWFLQRQGEQ